jgi:carbamoyl-phosphate synthase large subunit
LIQSGAVDLVLNTPFGRGPRSDGSLIRAAAASAGVLCITTIQGIQAAVQGIEALRAGLGVPVPLQEYHAAGEHGGLGSGWEDPWSEPDEVRATASAIAARRPPGE